MKQIKIRTSEYLEAPIDDKNVMSDSIIENLFDGGNYVWNKNEAVGFIAGYPCLATYYDNRLDITSKSRHPNTAGEHKHWFRMVIERVTGSEYAGKISLSKDNVCLQGITFLDDEANADCEECQLIMSFHTYLDNINVWFYWNHKK